MKKVFNMKKDHLEVTVTQDDKIFLPTENGNNEIGTYTQTTIQKIDKAKVKDLVDFVESENEKARTQLKAIENQLEPLKEVDEIDEKVVEACKKQIDKGTKVFKQKMLTLNNHLEQVLRRKQLTKQKEYIETQLKQMDTELTDLKKEAV